MAINFVVATAIKGQTLGAMDNIDVVSLAMTVGDVCRVYTPEGQFVYTLKYSVSPPTEDLYNIRYITCNPSGCTGWYWEIQSQQLARVTPNLIANNEMKILNRREILTLVGSGVSCTGVSSNGVLTVASHSFEVGMMIMLGNDGIQVGTVPSTGVNCSWNTGVSNLSIERGKVDTDKYMVYEIIATTSTSITVHIPTVKNYVSGAIHAIGDILWYSNRWYKRMHQTFDAFMQPTGTAPVSPDSNYKAIGTAGNTDIFQCEVGFNSTSKVADGGHTFGSIDLASELGMKVNRVQSGPYVKETYGASFTCFHVDSTYWHFIFETSTPRSVLGNSYISNGGMPKYRGKTFTFSAWLHGVGAQLYMYDGITTKRSTANTDTTLTYHEISMPVASDAQDFRVSAHLSGAVQNDKLHFSNVSLTENSWLGADNYIKNSDPIPGFGAFYSKHWTQSGWTGFPTTVNHGTFINVPHDTHFAVARGLTSVDVVATLLAGTTSANDTYYVAGDGATSAYYLWLNTKLASQDRQYYGTLTTEFNDTIEHRVTVGSGNTVAASMGYNGFTFK